MKKRKFRNLNLNVVKVASLSVIHFIKGGDGDTIEETCNGQGQTNSNGTSKVVRNCTVIGSKKDCLSDEC